MQFNKIYFWPSSLFTSVTKCKKKENQTSLVEATISGTGTLCNALLTSCLETLLNSFGRSEILSVLLEEKNVVASLLQFFLPVSYPSYAVSYSQLEFVLNII